MERASSGIYNENWLTLAGFIVLLGIVFGQAALLSLGILLLTILPVAWAWDWLALQGIRYEREFSEQRAFVGETITLRLRVANRKLLPVPWLRLEDLFPEEIPIEGKELGVSHLPTRGALIHVVSLRWYERVTWSYTLRCARRGFHFFGPATLASGDIFGLFTRQARSSHQDRLIVYPRVVPLPELGFPAKEPFGELRTRQPLFQDPIRTVGVRDYHPEDSFKHIHWKATARQQHLQVRVYEPTTIQHLVIFLNIATFAQPWVGIDPDRQEHTVSVAASIAYHATQKRYAVGLIANGSVPQGDQSIKVLPGRDPDQLVRILEALAAVTRFATTTIDQLLAAESTRLPWGATLVVVTPVVTEALLAEMVRLRDAGRRLALVSMDASFTGDSLSGITIYHLPDTEVTYRPRHSESGDEPVDDAVWARS